MISNERFQVFLEVMVEVRAKDKEKKLERRVKYNKTFEGPIELLACYNRSRKWCHRSYEPLLETTESTVSGFGRHWEMSDDRTMIEAEGGRKKKK